MKIVCTSDLHGDIESAERLADKIGDFDLLLIAGDVTNFSSSNVARHLIGELSESGVQSILVVPGNCDLAESLEHFQNTGISLHGSGKIMDGIGFFGVGGSNETPFNTPLEFSEDEITQLLQQGYEEIKNAKVKMLLTHPPPFGALDQPSPSQNVGSKSIAKFLEKNKVDLCICGHIHEAKGEAKLGSTEIINPGPTSTGYVEIQIDKEGNTQHKFCEL